MSARATMWGFSCVEGLGNDHWVDVYPRVPPACGSDVMMKAFSVLLYYL